MAEPDQLKKETVRIELPVRETDSPPILPSFPSDTGAAGENMSSKNFFPMPAKAPAASEPSPASVRSASVAAPAGSRPDTVRIQLMPESVRSSENKTQPPMAVRQVAQENPPIVVAPVEKSSMLLYWALLGVSALILIIQIWIYFS